MSEKPTLSITANGDTYSVASCTTLPEFIQERGLALERVVIELNGEALPRSQAQNHTLRDGDTLEIVRIVAGG